MKKADQRMVTFQWPEDIPAIESVAKKLGIPLDYIDLEYGVVPIDLEDNLFCVLVDKTGIPDEMEQGWSDEGSAFSNPKIEPFNLEDE